MRKVAFEIRDNSIQASSSYAGPSVCEIKIEGVHDNLLLLFFFFVFFVFLFFVFLLFYFFYLLLIYFLILHLILGRCPDASYWTWSNYCYRLQPVIKSFGDSELLCQSQGSHLASIHSEAEMTFLRAQLSRLPLFIFFNKFIYLKATFYLPLPSICSYFQTLQQ